MKSLILTLAILSFTSEAAPRENILNCWDGVRAEFAAASAVVAD